MTGSEHDERLEKEFADFMGLAKSIYIEFQEKYKGVESIDFPTFFALYLEDKRANAVFELASAIRELKQPLEFISEVMKKG